MNLSNVTHITRLCVSHHPRFSGDQSFACRPSGEAIRRAIARPFGAADYV